MHWTIASRELHACDFCDSFIFFLFPQIMNPFYYCYYYCILHISQQLIDIIKTGVSCRRRHRALIGEKRIVEVNGKKMVLLSDNIYFA